MHTQIHTQHRETHMHTQIHTQTERHTCTQTHNTQHRAAFHQLEPVKTQIKFLTLAAEITCTPSPPAKYPHSSQESVTAFGPAEGQAMGSDWRCWVCGEESLVSGSRK